MTDPEVSSVPATGDLVVVHVMAVLGTADLAGGDLVIQDLDRCPPTTAAFTLCG